MEPKTKLTTLYGKKIPISTTPKHNNSFLPFHSKFYIMLKHSVIL